MSQRSFIARFDSDCTECGGPILEGDRAAYVDDEVVCEECALEAW